MKLVECVPNFSEGRRPEVVSAIRDAIAAVESVALLDVSSDASHNRTVVTFVVAVEHAVEAAFAGIRAARDRIDLNSHSGEHPRMGATDVVPFVPLEGSTMEDCIVLAKQLGERVGKELEIPVFLYERAATRPDRENLADIRRGDMLKRVLYEDKGTGSGWYWQLKNLPNSPESRYLYTVLAGHDFQEGLKNYHQLVYMSDALGDWDGKMLAFQDMIATRERATCERECRTSCGSE